MQPRALRYWKCRPTCPNSHVLEDSFATISFAAFVPKGHDGHLAYVGEVLEEAKTSGLTKSFIERAGLSRAFHEHKNFAVPYVILCEKLRSKLRINSYGGVWVACLNRAHGLTFVRNGNKGPFLQWQSTPGFGSTKGDVIEFRLASLGHGVVTLDKPGSDHLVGICLSEF